MPSHTKFWEVTSISGLPNFVESIADSSFHALNALLKSLQLQFIQAFKLSKFIITTFIFIISSLNLCKLLCCVLRYEVKFQKTDKTVCSRDSIAARYRFCTKFKHGSEIITVCGQRLLVIGLWPRALQLIDTNVLI